MIKLALWRLCFPSWLLMNLKHKGWTNLLCFFSFVTPFKTLFVSFDVHIWHMSPPLCCDTHVKFESDSIALADTLAKANSSLMEKLMNSVLVVPPPPPPHALTPTAEICMMTSSNGNICHFTGLLWGWPTDSTHKDQQLRALMIYLICAWTNGWVNTRNAGDLRRHSAH